jgi:hypothetical protein
MRYLRRRGYRPEEAQDLTQGFFARLLETDSIRTADPARGQVPVVSADGAEALRHQRARALRGGRSVAAAGSPISSLNFDEAERASTPSSRGPTRRPTGCSTGAGPPLALDRAPASAPRANTSSSDARRSPTPCCPYLTDTGQLPPYRTERPQRRT